MGKKVASRLGNKGEHKFVTLPSNDIFPCDCLNERQKFVRARNYSIIGTYDDKQERAYMTVTIEKTMRGGSVRPDIFIANYCPFCGAKAVGRP